MAYLRRKGVVLTKCLLPDSLEISERNKWLPMVYLEKAYDRVYGEMPWQVL